MENFINLHFYEILEIIGFDKDLFLRFNTDTQSKLVDYIYDIALAGEIIDCNYARELVFN